MTATLETAARRRGAGWNRIRCGDARRLLRGIDDDSVDLSLWSPPYHIGREYERGRHET